AQRSSMSPRRKAQRLTASTWDDLPSQRSSAATVPSHLPGRFIHSQYQAAKSNSSMSHDLTQYYTAWLMTMEFSRPLNKCAAGWSAWRGAFAEIMSPLISPLQVANTPFRRHINPVFVTASCSAGAARLSPEEAHASGKPAFRKPVR